MVLTILQPGILWTTHVSSLINRCPRQHLSFRGQVTTIVPHKDHATGALWTRTSTGNGAKLPGSRCTWSPPWHNRCDTGYRNSKISSWHWRVACRAPHLLRCAEHDLRWDQDAMEQELPICGEVPKITSIQEEIYGESCRIWWIKNGNRTWPEGWGLPLHLRKTKLKLEDLESVRNWSWLLTMHPQLRMYPAAWRTRA